MHYGFLAAPNFTMPSFFFALTFVRVGGILGRNFGEADSYDSVPRAQADRQAPTASLSGRTQ